MFKGKHLLDLTKAFLGSASQLHYAVTCSPFTVGYEL